MDYNPEHEWPNVIEVTVNNQNFRVNPLAFIMKKTNLKFLSVVWFQIVIASIFLMLIESSSSSLYSNKKYLPLLIQVIIYLCFLSLAACLNKTYLSPLFTYSSLLCTVYFLSVTVLYSRESQKEWIVSIAFVIAQTMLCFLFLQSYKIITILVIVGIQLVLIACKLDGKFQDAGWSEILIIVIILFLITTVVSACLIIFGLIQHFKQRELLQPIGIIYIGMTLFALSLSAGVIITDLTLSFPLYTVGIPCLLFHLFLIVFIKRNTYQICLYKSHALPLNIVQSAQTIKYPKIIKQTVLYKISEHFYSLKPKKQTGKRDTQLVIYSRQTTIECVVCLAEQALLVWMPCGHMTVCQVCGSYLMQRKRLKCVICKSKGQAIYHISKEQLKFEKEQYKSDFFYKIKNL